MHEPIAMPTCFSSGEKLSINLDHPATITTTRSSSLGSPQSLIMSIYRTKIASQSRLVTITWCKNLLLHGLSVSVGSSTDDHDDHYHCKVELKPWYFWRKQGSKQFMVENKVIGIVWDLKAAKFNGEVEPQSDYYVAVVCEDEVVLVIGDMKKDAFRRTGCRPSLVDPVLVSRKEHVFGKRRFATKFKFHEKGKSHDISVECNNGVSNNSNNNSNKVEGLSCEMNIKIDGELATRIKHLQWKFRGNESIDLKENKMDVYWDVHDWLFGSGPRYAMFLFKPSSSSHAGYHACVSVNEDGENAESTEFCLFLYAWKVE